MIPGTLINNSANIGMFPKYKSLSVEGKETVFKLTGRGFSDTDKLSQPPKGLETRVKLEPQQMCRQSVSEVIILVSKVSQPACV